MKTRHLLLLIALLIITLWLASCAPAATSAPSYEVKQTAAKQTADQQKAVAQPTSVALPTSAQLTTAQPSIAQPTAAQPTAASNQGAKSGTQQAPAATTAKESTNAQPTPASEIPKTVSAATSTSVSAQTQVSAPTSTPVGAPTSTPIVENRLVELEWPPRMRLGDSDIVRLALVPYKEGYIVEAEFPEHQVQSQTVPVQRLEGYTLAAVARLDGIGFEIQPAGDQQQSLPVDQPITWRWTLRPRYPGQQRLAVMVLLQWLPETDSALAQRQALLYSKGVDVQVTSFLGMTRGQAMAGGFFGLIFGSGLGLFALIFRSRPPAPLLHTLVPNPRLTIETTPGMALSEAESGLLRALFQRYTRLSLIREFLSGYSGARTFLALPVRPDGRVDAYTIVKIGARPDIEREYGNYESYVRNSLPPITARIQQAPVTVRGSDRAALQYTFIAEPGRLPVSLRLALLEKPDPELLHRLFNSFGPNWWMQRVPHVFHLGEEYDRLLPPHYVLQPVTANGQNLPQVEETLSPGAGRLEVGSLVSVARFSKTERRLDGVSLTLSGRPGAGQPPLRLRWLSPTPPNHTPARVIATRQDLLRDYTQGFELCGLPHPLLRLDELLNETVMGTQSIIHGDLNLENVLVGPGGFVWLIDFAQTRPGHPLFDFARLATEIIAHVLSARISSNRDYLDMLSAGDVLLQAVTEIAAKCLSNPSVKREYDLALYVSCLGALKFTNLDQKQKQLLYLTAATICQGL